ncbi:MAG: TraB/GumN family protein [Sphingobacteriales bacterium]|nr:MAG: TraB/GumN family protein [Sphingobacteriales bacterium]
MRVLLITVFFFLNIIALPAQNGKEIKKQAPVKSLLWEISGNGIKQPSYLFGTIHIMCKNDALLSKKMEKIIAGSSAVYLELDMDNMTELLGIFQYMNMKEGKKLSDYLTEEEVKRVKDWFVKNQPLIPVAMIEKMKPIFLSSMIGEKGFNCEQPDGMEMRIMEEAHKYNKEIKGLETMAYQAGVMDSIPYDVQAKELMKSIDSSNLQDSSVKMLINLYKQQDIDKLDTLMNKTEGEVGKYNEFLLYRRNRNWADKINTLIKSNAYLFAVGAGHLPGNKGLIALLRKMGYTVKPLENKWALPTKEL